MSESIVLQAAIETVRFWTALVLVGLGVAFTFVSTVGVIRLPDIYARAHTASQTDTLGAGFALAGVAVAFGWRQVTIYTVLLLFFVFLTNPTAAHAIARSAAESGVEPVLARTGEAETDGTPNAGTTGTGDARTDGSGGDVAGSDGDSGTATDGGGRR